MGGMLRLNSLRAFTIAITITGEHSFAAKLRCNARIHNSFASLSARALPHSFHSLPTPSEDDDYSELGPPVRKALSNPLKLMTEKPEPYMKTSRTRKPSGLPSKNSISLKDESSKLESSRRASLADEVGIKSFDLTIRPPDDQEAVIIRITNINPETTDTAVHSMCMYHGSLEGIMRTKEDAVDVLFSVKDNAGIETIIGKLNKTTLNSRKWSADLHQRNSATAPKVTSKESDANCDLGLDVSRHLGDLRRQISVKTVCIEDLEYLHNALLHLEAHPLTSSSVPNND